MRLIKEDALGLTHSDGSLEVVSRCFLEVEDFKFLLLVLVLFPLVNCLGILTIILVTFTFLIGFSSLELLATLAFSLPIKLDVLGVFVVERSLSVLSEVE